MLHPLPACDVILPRTCPALGEGRGREGKKEGERDRLMNSHRLYIGIGFAIELSSSVGSVVQYTLFLRWACVCLGVEELNPHSRGVGGALWERSLRRVYLPGPGSSYRPHTHSLLVSHSLLVLVA